MCVGQAARKGSNILLTEHCFVSKLVLGGTEIPPFPQGTKTSEANTGFVAKSADGSAGGMRTAMYRWFIAVWLCIGNSVN